MNKDTSLSTVSNSYLDLAKRFKEKLSKEYQVLFYKALEQNPTPRFKPYLSELKRILEIS